MLASQQTYAQTDPGSALLEEQLRAEQIRETEAVSGNEISAAPVVAPVPETVCFPIDRITVTGTSALAPEKLSGMIARFEAQCIGQASIGNLVNGISGLYAENGFITTRAYVPAQDINSRHLTIEVIEGRIESFVYQQADNDGVVSAGPPQKIIWAFPGRAGDVFQLRDLEHGLESMNRLVSSQATANLTAGIEPGTTRVIISEQKDDLWRGTLGVDNRGSSDTGMMQIRLGMETDDLLGVNDTWALSYTGSENTNAVAFSMSVPYGYWEFSLNGSYSESLSLLTPTSDLFTQTASVSARLERLLFRDDNEQFRVYTSVGSWWNERYVNIVPLTPQQHSALRVGWQYQLQLEKSSIFMDTSVSAGVPLWGADWTVEPAPVGTLLSDFTKLETQVSYQMPLQDDMQLSISLNGQMTQSPLFSNEQISIGGWDSVRGYAGTGASGDMGFYMRTDLYFAPVSLDFDLLGQQSPGSTVIPTRISGYYRPYVFADFGEVRSISLSESTELAGIGFGISATVGRVNIQAAAAVPIVEREDIRTDNIQAFVNVSLKLF